MTLLELRLRSQFINYYFLIYILLIIRSYKKNVCVLGVMWSICGTHDHGWTDRDVSGKVRCMVQYALARKFDINLYCSRYVKNFVMGSISDKPPKNTKKKNGKNTDSNVAKAGPSKRKSAAGKSPKFVSKSKQSKK